MASYKITEVTAPALEEYSSFDSLIRPDLSSADIKKILEFLKPYYNSSIFKDGSSIMFLFCPEYYDCEDYYSTGLVDRKFIVSKERSKCIS